MRDDEARLEWYNCRECEGLYTWFKVDIMDGLIMYGWLHWDEMANCSRNTGMTVQDFRGNIEGSDGGRGVNDGSEEGTR